MSRMTHTSAIRPFAVAAIITTAALAAPAVSHAQTGGYERALLNRVAVPIGVAPFTAFRTTAGNPESAGTVTGEQALLARTPAGDAVVLLARADSFAVAPVDGRRALVGRR